MSRHRAPAPRRRTRRTALGPLLRVLVLLGSGLALGSGVALSGCAILDGDDPAGSSAGRPGAGPSTSPTNTPSVDPHAPSGWGPTIGEVARAEDLVGAMSLEQRVATVLMPGFWGHDGRRPTVAEAALNQRMHRAASAVQVARRDQYAGFFLRPEVIGDAAQLDRLTTSLHAVGDRPEGLPLLLAMDQEGGGVQRLKAGVEPVPAAATVGATGDPAYARRVARDNGRTLRRLGVTMVFAPVADVDPDGRSSLGSRVYSSDVQVATRMVRASVNGYLAAGVVPVVKHFPGLGTVAGDSHRTLPVQPKGLGRLLRTDLVPFAAVVEAGAPAVMVGHVEVPALEPGVPASLSRVAIEEVLRGRLGFDGVAITDSQGMAPIHARYGPAEGAVRSLLAGNDLVLNSPRPAKARRAVLAAVRTGRLSEERVTEAATRVTALRIYQQRLADA